MLKKNINIFLLLISFFYVLFLSQNNSVQTLSKYGSQGDEVKKIQSILKEKGYYDGTIDGIFGNGTKNAVISYQKENGLSADGIAGPKTLQSLGIDAEDKSSSNNDGEFSNSDVQLLARIISAEARGEPYTGQVAIGAVILNRIEHPSFPNTLSGVIYQPGAFSCLNDGQVDQPVADSANRAAQDAINGLDPSNGAIYYYNPQKTSNKFMLSRPVITTIGKHKFCS